MSAQIKGLSLYFRIMPQTEMVLNFSESIQQRTTKMPRNIKKKHMGAANDSDLLYLEC